MHRGVSWSSRSINAIKISEYSGKEKISKICEEGRGRKEEERKKERKDVRHKAMSNIHSSPNFSAQFNWYLGTFIQTTYSSTVH